jgi:hypothetical protein
VITLKTISAIEPNSTIWDSGKGSLVGFGIRRQRGTAVSFVVKYRVAGQQRWITLGRHGPWVPETARAEAKRILGAAAAGKDPAAAKQEARRAIALGELCDQYLADCKAGRVLTRRKMAKSPPL